MGRMTLAVSSIVIMTSVAHAQSTTRVSVSSTGVQGDDATSPFIRPSISANGRFVAFLSYASNLVPGDTNGVSDVFVHDRQTGTTTRIDLTPGGAQILAGAERPCISADGRFVVYDSGSDQLVPGDFNNQQDVFVHDRVTGVTTLDSLTSTGAQANDGCLHATISADGRFVAFQSSATNLVPGDTNGQPDIFVRDRVLGTTTRVNVSSTGTQANNITDSPRIAAGGRYVSFASAASNLVSPDTNGTWDIFVHDLVSGQTTRASVGSGGTEANGASLYGSSLSPDGRFAAFQSQATNLVAGDTNFFTDIFVHDRQTGTTTRESLTTTGAQGDNESFGPTISANGRFVAYYSFATNLVPGDTNFRQDIFLRDRQLGVTTRESVSTTGAEANHNSDNPEISGNGRFIAFPSQASNLVLGDTNSTFDVFVRDTGVATPGDINGDGVVDGADLAIVLGGWGPCAGCPGDLNGDGIVDGADLAIVLGNWT